MKWSKSEIQQARKLPLAPLLRQRGISLRELSGDNYRVELYDDLFVKYNYWIWKSRSLHGNTIDYFIHIENLSFSETMQLLFPK